MNDPNHILLNEDPCLDNYDYHYDFGYALYHQQGNRGTVLLLSQRSLLFSYWKPKWRSQKRKFNKGPWR